MHSLPADARPIPGYEDDYAVTPDGRVFSLNYRHLKGRVGELALVLHPEGYVRVKAGRINARSPTPVHRLVAMTFLPNPGGLPQVNHINGRKGDNRVENLEWCTNQRNQQHAFDMGLQVARKGEKHHMASITDEVAKEIYAASRGGLTSRQIAAMFNASKYVVDDIRARKSWKHIHD